MATQPAFKHWTYDDVGRLPDDGNRYEIIAGELIVTPAPGWKHQRAACLLARALEVYGAGGRITESGIELGTPGYMAPEQRAGDPGVDARADVFALGLVGYEMFAGRLPFEASDIATFFVKHLKGHPLRCAS